MPTKIALSICIPTFGRPECVERSLANYQKIIDELHCRSEVQVCISDNNQDGITKGIVERFMPSLTIKYHQNDGNLGYDRNSLNSMLMADGEYIHLTSDENLFTAEALGSILERIRKGDLEMLISTDQSKHIVRELNGMTSITGEELFQYTLEKHLECCFFIPMKNEVFQRKRLHEIRDELEATEAIMTAIMVHEAIFIYCAAKAKTIQLEPRPFSEDTTNVAKMKKIYLQSQHVLLVHHNHYFLIKACMEHGFITKDTFISFRYAFRNYLVNDLVKARTKVHPSIAESECRKMREHLAFLKDEIDSLDRPAMDLSIRLLLIPWLPYHWIYQASQAGRKAMGKERPNQCRAPEKGETNTIDYLSATKKVM